MKKNIIGVLCPMIGLALFANVALAADVTPPKTNVNSPSNNAIVKGLVGTSCYATDDVKVTKSELYIDNVLKASGAPSMSVLVYDWDSSAATAGSHTIYCKAYDAAGNVATSVVRTFTLDKSPDTTAPVIVYVWPANGETVSGLYDFAANATDDYGVISKITLYLDGASIGAGIAKGNSFWARINTTKLANGNHTFYAVAVDPAGNATTSATDTFKIYNEKPSAVITSPADGAKVGGTFKISATAKATTDIHSLTFYVNDALSGEDSTVPYESSPYDTRTQPNGTALKIYAQVYDTSSAYGNSPTVNATVYNDISNWEVKINNPANGATVSGIVPIKTFSTNAGMTTLYVDGKNVINVSCADCSFNWNSATVADGAHTMYIDTFWNGTIYSSPVIAIATNNGKPDPGDTINPTVSLDFPKVNYIFKTAGEWNFYATASDNIGLLKVEFYDGDKLLGSDPTDPFSYKWTISAADNGPHSIIAKAYDMKGNVGVSGAVPVTVNIPGGSDTTKPTVSITAPTNNASYTSAQTAAINASASDNVSVSKVEFYDGTTLLGNDTTSPYSYNWAITAVNNGAHSLTAKAYDAAGNSAVSTAVSVTVNIVTGDITKPTVSITAPTNNANYTSAQNVAINATASDNVGVNKVEFYDGTTLLGADTVSPYSYDWTIIGASNGAHSLTAKAYDAAGNTGVCSPVSVTVNIVVADTSAPTVSLTSPAANTNYTSAQTVTLAATASDNVGVTKVEFYDGTTLLGTDTTSSYNYPWVITSANNGSHSLTAKAYDAAGNSKVSATVNVTVNIVVGCTSNAACDDGIYCNGAETCQAGTCVKGAAVTCNDSNSCTADTCSEAAKACAYSPLVDNTSCVSGVCCAGTCKAGMATCSGTGTICWNGSNQNLYLGTALLNKFCLCAQGTYSYKAYKLNPTTGKIVSWYYTSSANTENWAVKSVTSSLSAFSVTCSDGKTYPTNQTYTYPAPISATVNNNVTASQESLDSFAQRIQSIQASLASIMAQIGK